MTTAVSPSLNWGLGAGWRRALPALGLLWLLTLWLYRDTALAMVEVWNRSETFAHAWVVPPISLWLAWRMRHQVLAIDPRPVPWVLLLFVPAGLLWLMGEAVVVSTAKQFALVGLLVAAVPAVLGLSAARLLAFPLGFLFFAVPAGEFLTPTLMSWTAHFTIGALRLSGIPVYQEGLQFVIPSGRWSVVEACSGIRYLIASVMVGTLFAYLNYRSLRRRLLFVAVSVVVPVLANWVRAYMIVMLGHLSGNELAVGADHLVYGWVLFGIVVMALYAIGARWAEHIPEPPVLSAATAAWPAGRGAVALGLGALLLAWPLWAWQRLDISASATSSPSLTLPTALPGGWRADQDLAPDWQPGFVAPSASARASFVAGDGRRAGIYLAYYRQQNNERKLVSSINGVVAGNDPAWIHVAAGRRTRPVPGGQMRLREERLLQSDTTSRLAPRQHLRIWRVYWVDGQWVTGDAEAKLRGAWGRLMGRGDDSAVVMLYADDADGEQAQAVLARLLDDGLPALVTQLTQARQQAQ